jgi:aminoacrylate hydrolase
MKYDRRAKAGAVKAPTLVICAADDVTTPPYLSEELARLIPGAALKILPKGGHFAPIVEPESYNAALLGFLKSVP